MSKNLQKWAYALLASVLTLTMCFGFVSCSSDDDVDNKISPVLYSESNGEASVNCPLSLTGEFVGISIPLSQLGKQVDLTQPGDWTVGGSIVKGLYTYDDHFFQKGSFVYLRRIDEHNIEMRFKFVWKDGTRSGEYKGKMTTREDVLDLANRNGNI